MRYLVIVVLLVVNMVLAQTFEAELNSILQSKQYNVEYVNRQIVKLTDKTTGFSRFINIRDNQDDLDNTALDTQIINLAEIDTTIFEQAFFRGFSVPIGGSIGYPLVIGDFNNNQQLDVAGQYKIQINTQFAESAIFELEDPGNFKFRKLYTDSVTVPLAATDLDKDGLMELNIRRGQVFYNYESSHPDSFPNLFNFSHRMWEISSVVGSETFLDLDNDRFMDVLYIGDDSLPPCCQKIFVAEYDPVLNRFQKRFSYHPAPSWQISGISVGDFDEDGFTEFATGSIAGDVYIFENNGNNEYQQIFQDTISATNAYLSTETNDIDDNGLPEFFVGGSSYYQGMSGSRIYWFEAGDNNQYHQIRSVFLSGTSVLGVSRLSNADINLDGKDDLIFAFEFGFLILTWNPLGYFDLYYLDLLENVNQAIHSVTVHNIYEDSSKVGLFLTVKNILHPPRVKSIYYHSQPVNSIGTVLHPETISSMILGQNYPNPFNNSTTIEFELNKPSKISMIIYTISGKEVVRLISDRYFISGLHQIHWNGKNSKGESVSSGIYLYAIQSERFGSEFKKMLLIK